MDNKARRSATIAGAVLAVEALLLLLLLYVRKRASVVYHPTPIVIQAKNNVQFLPVHPKNEEGYDVKK